MQQHVIPDSLQTTMLDNSIACDHCGEPFTPRVGGKPQRFCSDKCRLAFHAEQRATDKATVAAIKQRGTLPTVTPDLAGPKTVARAYGRGFRLVSR